LNSRITQQTHQFPPFSPDLPNGKQRKDLNAGLGVIVFDGPQGPRSEAGFAALVKFILGETGVPYEWEYGDRAIKS